MHLTLVIQEVTFNLHISSLSLCQGLTPQNGFVWFLPSWLASDWWQVDNQDNYPLRSFENDVDVPCSTNDMQQFISGGYFSLSNAYFGNSLDVIQGGGTVEQWRQEYEERVKKEVILEKKGYIAASTLNCLVCCSIY